MNNRTVASDDPYPSIYDKWKCDPLRLASGRKSVRHEPGGV